MKKLIFAGLLICLCVALVACTVRGPDALFETEPDNAGVSTPEDTQSDVVDIMYYTGKYQYGNMQKTNSGNFLLLNNEVVFDPFQQNHNVLYSYDLLTEKTQPLCKDATCKHGACVAGKLQSNLEVYKGKLYGIDYKTRDGASLPAVVNENVPEIILDKSISSFFHHEDKLYIEARNHSLMVLEEGQEEPQTVLEECSGFWYAIWENYLYTNTWDFNIKRTDITMHNSEEEVLVANAQGMSDGQYIYYVDHTTSQLYRCNMDGSDPQLIEDREVMGGSINFDDEYFYYRLFTDESLVETPDCYDIYSFPKDDPTQIEKIVTLPDPVSQVFTVPGTGKIFVTSYQFEKDEDDNIIYGDPLVYVMGTDGSNPTKLEFPEY